MSKSRENSTNILNIWDSEQPCFINNGQVLLWRQFVTPNSLPNVVSICEIVEERATEIRPQLLKYIYDVGESINNNSKTQLRLKQDFNYFWMTQFHSRPYTESGQLNNLAKVFTLIQIIKENKWLTEKEVENINDWVKKEVDESVEFAENSPYPEAHELYEDIYVQTDYPYIKEY